MGGGPPGFRPGSTCPVLLWCLLGRFRFSNTGPLPSMAGRSSPLLLSFDVPCHRSTTPNSEEFGLASFPFARRYLENRVCFLFLRVLRCFSSPRYLQPPYFIQAEIHAHCRMWVPPFGNLRITGYVLLTAAYRSLSRPSSAPSAKASALCSFSLNLSQVHYCL